MQGARRPYRPYKKRTGSTVRGGADHEDSDDIDPTETNLSRGRGGRGGRSRGGSRGGLGYVVHIESENCGYVSYEDDPSAKHGVIFWYYWVEQLSLIVGDRLQYRIAKEKGKDVAKNISLVAPPESDRGTNPAEIGTITFISAHDRGAATYLLATSTGQQRVQPRKVHFGYWHPKMGDQVVTELQFAKKTGMRVVDMKLEKPVNRSDDEIGQFIESLGEITSDKDVRELLAVPTSWAIVGQWSQLTADWLYPVLKFFVQVNTSASAYQQCNLSQCILNLMHERNFQLGRGPYFELYKETASKRIPSETVSVLKTFCEMVGRLVPQRCYLTMQVCQRFYATHFTCNEAFEFAKLVCHNFLPVRNADLSWHELSITVNKEEILSSVEMGEMVQMLPAIRTHTPYDSVEDYYETNLKLLHADCFEKLKSGIRQFVRGTLNQRDLTIYHQVELCGVDITQRELSLVLRVKPFNREVKDWDKSPLLMFGNLLCLSFDEAFSEVVSVTVSNRDSKLLNKSGLVFVEVVSESSSTELADLLRKLRLNRTMLWMAESPTYYQAYRHVLKNLQTLHGKTLPLESELVSCSFEYIDNDRYEPPEEENEFAEYEDKWTLRHRVKAEIRYHMDASQSKAFENCTRRRISIIQGPPGCGKTYVGTHLVRFLTAPETREDRKGPVLLVTYKNNALDEFIRKIRSQYSSGIDMIRFGGRSKKTEVTKDLDIRARRDQYPDMGCKEIWRFLEQAKGKLLQKMTSLFDQENVVFNEHFLSTYWNENSQNKFWKQFLQQPVCRNQGHVPHVSALEKLRIAVRQWIPHQSAIGKFMPSLLQTSNFTETQGSKQDSVDTFEDVDDEINDEQEQMKLERLLAAGGDNRDIAEISLFLKENESSSVKLDRRLIRIVSEKWQVLRYKQNLWDLKPEDRFLFMQGCLLDHIERVWRKEAASLNSNFSHFKNLRDEMREASLARDVEVCRGVDVIAMTITGASINNELLKKLRPNTVVVEEAAEIMEPMLLACLGDWTERLFLIGDHKQLRPTVENFELVKHCHLDVSMMERLINCGFPFDCLQFQNRMRPDISKYLKLDVYPDLKDNLKSVSGHQIPLFMPNAVAFWDVENMPELGERSYKNEGEAELVVHLAVTFLRFGFRPNQITILTPYQGQVRLIRQKLRPKVDKWKSEECTEEAEASARSAASEVEGSDDFIKVHSIDVFQGDENDVILVSLVRSSKPGFLASLNRRCVAQSRSRCALVLIGKASLLRRCPEWSKLLGAFEADGVLRPDFPVVCKTHGTEHSWSSAQQLASAKGSFCKAKCMHAMPCGKHVCPKLCHPYHEHSKCEEPVMIRLPCTHPKQVKCCQSGDPYQLVCNSKCLRKLSCGHVCQRVCSVQCSEIFCTVEISVTLRCGHVQSKLCNQPVLPCQEEVQKTLPCGHSKKMLCADWQKTSLEHVKCLESCNRLLSCGHKCTLKCFETCTAELCEVAVPTKCIICKSSFQTKCGKKQTQCDRLVALSRPCGHNRKVICSQAGVESRKSCSSPCEKAHSCGHKCQATCGTTPCPPCSVRVRRDGCRHECNCWELQEQCLTDVTKRFQCGHDEALPCCTASRKDENQLCSACWSVARQVKLRQLQALKAGEIRRTPVTKENEETAVEFFKVFDRVMRYIKSEHTVTVTEILSIERIENAKLDQRLLEVCWQLVKKDAAPELFFHGTSNDVAERIIIEGFRPGARGMYGAGIYFATDTTKSVQYCREPGTTKSLLLCDVVLGKSLVCDAPRNDLSLQTVVAAGYDSVFARRDTKGTGGVLNDEYIVYRSEQAAPRYLIRFR